MRVCVAACQVCSWIAGVAALKACEIKGVGGADRTDRLGWEERTLVSSHLFLSSALLLFYLVAFSKRQRTSVESCTQASGDTRKHAASSAGVCGQWFPLFACFYNMQYTSAFFNLVTAPLSLPPSLIHTQRWYAADVRMESVSWRTV